MLAGAADDDWPRYRGPDNDGVARGGVPLEFGGQEHSTYCVRQTP